MAPHTPQPRMCIYLCQRIKAKFLYQAALIFLGVSIVIPALVYFIVYDLTTPAIEEISTCAIDHDYRIPCGFLSGRKMGKITSKYICREQLSCCFDNVTKTCFHSIPAKYGYHRDGMNDMNVPSTEWTTPFGTPMLVGLCLEVKTNEFSIEAVLKLNVKSQGNKKTKKVHPSSTKQTRFPGVDYKISEDQLALEVFTLEKHPNTILQTAWGPLITSAGYWEWTVQLANKNGSLFGLGGLKVNDNFTRVFYRNSQDHTNIPLVIAQSTQADRTVDRFHALLLMHEGVVEMQVLESNIIIVRALNTTELRLKLFPGPTLKDLRRQLSEDIKIARSDGMRNIPRWLLGTHLCRNAVTDLKTMVEEFRQESKFNSLHTESDCFNELLVLLFMEMYSSGQMKINDELQQVFKSDQLAARFVLPFSPHIPIGHDERKPLFFYQLGIQMDVLLKNSTGHVQLGEYKNRRVAFWNASAPKAAEFFEFLLDAFKEAVLGDTQIAGVILLDNWPQDDSFNFTAQREGFVYYNEDIISALNQTPATLLDSQEIYIQNQVKAVRHYFAADDPPIPIISASQYYASTLPAYPQHVDNTWTALKHATTRTLFSSSFSSFPIMLNPICGTNTLSSLASQGENELCARWFLNLATMPGQRLTTNWFAHPNFTLQSRTIADKALELKRMLSYYQYSLLEERGTIVEPLMTTQFEADNKEETMLLDDEYMLGDLLVVPILLPRITERRFYLPANHAWFGFWDGINYGAGWQRLGISQDERLLFLKEASMVHMLNNNDDSFDLLVAKSCKIGRQAIQGSIFFDRHWLKLELFDNHFNIGNIYNVQRDLHCHAMPPTPMMPDAFPRVIKNVKVLDCWQPAHVYTLDFDVCQQNVDSVDVRLKSP